MPCGPITLQPQRHYATEGHRYGFNGKEMDNEVREEATTGTSGTGNHYDYGFRVYDPRIAKFLSVDPLAPDYPWYTPYQYAGNMPVRYVDLDGLEPAEPGTYTGQGARAPVKGEEDKGDVNWMNITEPLSGISVWLQRPGVILTQNDLKALYPSANDENLHILETRINLYGYSFGIVDYDLLSHYLAQAAHETGGFTKYTVIEGMYYSSLEIVKNAFGTGRLYNIVASNPGKYLKNPEAFGSLVYANKIGNGDEASGDGFRYRGHGFFQLTGKSNYRDFTNFYNERFNATEDFVANPSKVAEDDNTAIISSLWFFQTRTIPAIREGWSYRAITRTINSKANGLKERKQYYNEAVKHFENK